MSKRPFNKTAYNAFDMKAKIMLKNIIEKNSKYKLIGDLEVEYFKECDLKFQNQDKVVLFENEVRREFETIRDSFSTIHVPFRKKNTKANFYLVWKPDFLQFILINEKTLDKYRENIVRDVYCNHELNQNGGYFEDFVDIPKNETQWYVIGENYKLIKLDY